MLLRATAYSLGVLLQPLLPVGPASDVRRIARELISRASLALYLLMMMICMPADAALSAAVRFSSSRALSPLLQRHASEQHAGYAGWKKMFLRRASMGQ